MELEKLFLTKEEIVLSSFGEFSLPIHPKLLDENINLNRDIARRIFPEVAQDWYQDLNNYIQEEKPENTDWIKNVFLNEKPRIKSWCGIQSLSNLSWEDNISTLGNGFVNKFSISRNSGGSIYFFKEGFEFKKPLNPPYINFPEDKVKEFEFEKKGSFSIGKVYRGHNIDNYPGALFLRNWALMYMNEAFKEIFS